MDNKTVLTDEEVRRIAEDNKFWPGVSFARDVEKRVIAKLSQPAASEAGAVPKGATIERDSDFSVRVYFPSCRLASEFERFLRAAPAAQPEKQATQDEALTKLARKAYPHLSVAELCTAPPAPSQQAAPAAVSAEPANPDKCNADVFTHGVSMGVFGMTKQQAEAYCKAETARTGRLHDWHYVAGRVHVKALIAQPTAATADAQGDERGNHDGAFDTHDYAQQLRGAFQVPYWLCCGALQRDHSDRRRRMPDCFDPTKAKFGTPAAHRLDRAALSRQPSAPASVGDVDADRYRWLFDVRTEEEANDYNVGLAPDKPQDIVLAQLACRYFHKALADALIDEARAALVAAKPEGGQ